MECEICKKETGSDKKPLCYEHWKQKHNKVNRKCKRCGQDTGSIYKDLCRGCWIKQREDTIGGMIQNNCIKCGEKTQGVQYCDKCSKELFGEDGMGNYHEPPHDHE